MPGIYQVHLRYILFQEKRIYPGYTWYILSESAISRPGLYLVYTRFMPAHLKSCNPSCSISAIGMQRHTGFGLQGCLMFITARAIPTGHRSARAGTGRPRRRRGGRRCVAPVHHFFFLAPAGAFFSFLPPGDGLGVAVWLPAAAAPSSPRQAPPATVSSPCLPPLSPWIPPSPVSSPSLSSPAPQLLSASPPAAVSASAAGRRRRGTRRPGRRRRRSSTCAQHLQPRISDEHLGAISWFTRVAKQLDEAAPNIPAMHDVGLSCVCEFVYIQVQMVEQKHQQIQRNIHLRFSK
jgi:hypothetical protein